MSDPFEITVTRSSGKDGAIVVFIDGPLIKFDGGPGIRVLVNDFELEEENEVKYEPYGEDEEFYNGGGGRQAREQRLAFTLEDVDYLDGGAA